MVFLEYRPTSTTMVVTRNPFGFVNKMKEKRKIKINQLRMRFLKRGEKVKLLINLWTIDLRWFLKESCKK